MKIKLSKLLSIAVALTAAIIFSNTSYSQTTPTDLEDLVGAKAAGGELTLKNRGYVLKHTDESDDSKYQYWYSASKNRCLVIRVYEGTYNSIVTTSSIDCNTQPGNKSNISGSAAPADVADLVDARASTGETELKSRGFVLTNVTQGNDKSYAYWWNNSNKECLCVITQNGRYASLDVTSNVDCNQVTSSSYPHSTVKKNDHTGAKIAVGAAAAAAIVGAAILVNKSHHHDNGHHYDNAESEAAFEAGYRAGMYNTSYYNNFGSGEPFEAYRKGYDAGIEQRKIDTPDNNNYNRGSSSYVKVKDLRGASVEWADNELYRRGFKLVDNSASGDVSFLWFYNNASRQCIMITVENNTYRNIQENTYNNKCK